MPQAWCTIAGLGVLPLMMLQVKYTAVYELKLNFGSLESFISLISIELHLEHSRDLMNDIKERCPLRRKKQEWLPNIYKSNISTLFIFY